MLIKGATGVVTRIFRENSVIVMASEALASHIATTSAAIVLIIQDERVFVFKDEAFQLTTCASVLRKGLQRK